MVDDDPETIDASPQAAPDKMPAITLNALPMLVPEPTEIATELCADKPLPISKAPLLPMLAGTVFNDRSPNTPAVPLLLVNTTMLPELVAVPKPNEMVIEPPEAVLPLPPSIVTAPPLVLPSPEARVKLLPLLVDDNPETVDGKNPAAPEMLSAITLSAHPMLVSEPTENAMLPPEPEADKPLLISKAPLPPTLTVPVFSNRSPTHTRCSCIAHQYGDVSQACCHANAR
jgi:hypothetical protein